MIRRGFIYQVSRIFRDPRHSRPVLVLTSDARNLDPRSLTVVGIPITTSLKGGVFRVRIRRGIGGLSETSEAACEQIVQVPKENFVPNRQGRVLPMGDRLNEATLGDVVAAVVRVISP
jgi:mRNA-degrading endonuclease toxin of MazEF toxin-antitoxin module